MHQPLNPHLELSTEEWEDLCRESGGWEWIDGEVGDEMGKGKERNEFGGKWFFRPCFIYILILAINLHGAGGWKEKNVRRSERQLVIFEVS